MCFSLSELYTAFQAQFLPILLSWPFYAFVFVLLQLLFIFVCLLGWTFLFLPYIFMTVQNGAHLVFLWRLTNLCFLLGCLCLAILFVYFYLSFLRSHLLKYFFECDV